MASWSNSDTKCALHTSYTHTCTCTLTHMYTHTHTHTQTHAFVVRCQFQRPISLGTRGLGDYKVARMGTPTTDYKLVRLWESGI